jgi:hypothetical protein
MFCKSATITDETSRYPTRTLLGLLACKYMGQINNLERHPLGVMVGWQVEKR